MTAGKDLPLRAPSLLQLSAQIVSHSDEITSSSRGKPHLPLPASHALFAQFRQEWQRNGTTTRDSDMDRRNLCSRVLRTWCDSQRFPLTEMDLSGARVDDGLLADLLTAHQLTLTQLDMTNVEGLTGDANCVLDARGVEFPQLSRVRMTSLEMLSPYQPRRKMGTAGLDNRIVPILGEEDLDGTSSLPRPTPNHPYDHDYPCVGPSVSGVSGGDGGPSSSQSSDSSLDDEQIAPLPFTSKCPHLTELYLPRHRRFPEDEESSVNELLTRVLEPLPKLSLLDLSHWQRVEDLRCLTPLRLTTLILYDVPDLYRAIDRIITLSELRFLDVSQSCRDTGTYPRPVTTLHNIVTNLRHLTHLDISSTNLASQPSPFDRLQGNGTIRSDIVGLSYLDRPLEYLGLFNCDNASHVAEIPADRISGDANEDQVITALQMYGERAGLLQAVLNESYQLYRFGNSNPLTRHTEALHLVLGAMRRHLHDSTLQIAGSASLFYIIRKVQMNRDTKKSVVSALLSGMETHMEEQVMVRNCCLSLCQFEIPQEILFDYSRLAILLVQVLQHHNSDNLTQRIVVFLLNSMACHVEGDQKVQVGTYGAIEMILDQIKRKLAANMCDDVMEVGWSFLWNITDETPVNCELFLRADGLALFHKCYEAFRNERELVRNMMGLIGNIAEVDSLRVQLMNDDYINIFCALLELVEDSIEISYNSAGVLAHVVSDGEAAWEGLTVQRDDVMAKIVKATEQWKLDTRRFINYRSFRPILRLLPQWHAFASQHWAVWALANLTTTDPMKYCAFVADEGGVELLEALVTDSRTTGDIRTLAANVLGNIAKWRSVMESEAAEEAAISHLMVGSVESMDTSD